MVEVLARVRVKGRSMSRGLFDLLSVTASSSRDEIERAYSRKKLRYLQILGSQATSDLQNKKRVDAERELTRLEAAYADYLASPSTTAVASVSFSRYTSMVVPYAVGLAFVLTACALAFSFSLAIDARRAHDARQSTIDSRQEELAEIEAKLQRFRLGGTAIIEQEHAAMEIALAAFPKAVAAQSNHHTRSLNTRIYASKLDLEFLRKAVEEQQRQQPVTSPTRARGIPARPPRTPPQADEPNGRDALGVKKLARDLEARNPGLTLGVGWVRSDVRLGGGTGWVIRLEGAVVGDLSPLRGHPIYRLQLIGSEKRPLTIKDYTPLAELPLQSIEIRYAKTVPLVGLSTWRQLRSLTLISTNTENFTPLANLPRLKTLIIHDATLADIGSLRVLSKLTALDLSKTKVTNLSSLGSLPLQTLTLNKTPVRDLAPLRQIRSLRTLYIEDTRVSDLEPLHDSALKNLYLRGAPVADLLHLRSIPLQQLGLSDRPYLNDSVLLLLSTLKGVTIKQKRYNRISALKYFRALGR